jgi:hypothetical protein
MKKTLLTLALVALTAVASYAQGTIAFGNSALTRVQFRAGAPGTATVNFDPATLGANIQIGVFVNGSATPVPGFATIGTTAGVMINAPSVYALPGTQEGQVVSLQIRAWETGAANDWQHPGRFYGETDVRQVTLGPTAGPGQVIWQTATGTNPNRFTPLMVIAVPEPSMIALAVLGLGSLLLFRRRK